MVELVDSMSALQLEGLMTLPPHHQEAEASRPYFQKLAKMQEEVNRNRQLPLKELSMGMSQDYRVAIEEGATLVRLGTAIFGPRPSL